jgi:MFS transporter, UMF1 family
MFHRLNPFRSLPNPREVWAWGMYDLANQSFQLLINTLLFSIFVQSVIVQNDPSAGSRLWMMMIAIAQMLVVALSPIVGAMADQKAWKRELLLASGIVCSVATASLALLQPGQAALATALFVVAAVSCGLGENFLASFLPEIAPRERVGFVSALGWTMSYVGALLLLGIVAAFCFALGRDKPDDARPIFVFAGVWFILGMVPAFLFLHERARPSGAASGAVVAGALRQLVQTAREASRFRQLARFLLIFFVYSMGTNAIIYFLGQIGVGFGFKLPKLVGFALLMAATAGAAAAAAAKFQDRIGHRRTVSIFLLVWSISTAGMGVAKLVAAPEWAFWVVSGAIGCGLGGIGTSSRAMVGAFTPSKRSAEFFGLWGLASKLSVIAGAILFGSVSTRVASDLNTGQAVACFMLAGFFALGLVLMLTVNTAEGIRTAQVADEAANA